jgi:hypothetical protein
MFLFRSAGSCNCHHSFCNEGFYLCENFEIPACHDVYCDPSILPLRILAWVPNFPHLGASTRLVVNKICYLYELIAHRPAGFRSRALMVCAPWLIAESYLSLIYIQVPCSSSPCLKPYPIGRIRSLRVPILILELLFCIDLIFLGSGYWPEIPFFTLLLPVVSVLNFLVHCYI